MINKTILLSLLMAIFSPMAMGQQTLTVHDKPATSQYVPYYGYFADAYQVCEFIMPAEELSEMTGQHILGLTWYLNSTAIVRPTGTFQIFMKEVEESTIGVFYGMDEATIVYEGQLDGSSTPMLVEFSMPYYYNGGNLLIGVYETVPSENYSRSFFLGETVADASVQGYSFTSLEDVSPTQRNFLPKTTFTYGVPPSCLKPKNLALVSDPGSREAELTWVPVDDTQDLWEIAVNGDETNLITTTAIPYTLTNLEPETSYAVKVRANCGEGDVSDWSEEITFITDVLCHAPSSLNATNVVPTEATLEWSDDASSYEVRYGLYPSSTGSSWLRYDNGSYATSFGGSVTSTWCWGVMYPAQQITGNYLTKVKLYETSYNVNDITISVYTGGGEAPSTLLYTEVIAPEGEGWHEVTLNSPVEIVPGQNLWITLKETGTYVMAACRSTQSNNQWVNYGGWNIIGNIDTTLSSYGWMIRGYMETLDINSVVWNSDTCTDNSYLLTGLNPATHYIAYVRANCVEDGFSEWASTHFTTPTTCDVPHTLMVSNVTGTSASLSWVGYQDAYNIRYTIPSHINSDAFTQIGDDITTDGVLTQYTFDLSGFSGTGTIAIRHYHISDMYYLNVDDITLTDSEGTLLFAEDFENGSLPSAWTNYDVDGDGFVWGIRSVSGDDAQGNAYGNGAYCATSASWISGYGALEPDNWLMITDAQLGGTLTLYARGQDPNNAEEVFGVFVTTEEAIVSDDITIVENVTEIPYLLENLQPETTYEVQVQGINASCDGGVTEWSEIIEFSTPEIQNTTIALSAGWNWFSTYLDITLNGLKAALVEALGSTSITIVSQSDGSTTYNGTTWRGTLNTLDVSQMYMIKTSAECEITLTGNLIDPAEHPVTIHNGVNWIAFPLGESLSLTNAFAGFAVNGDMVISQSDGSSTYTNRWRGSLSTLVPGKGYIYKSNVAGDRTFVFPMSAK